mmetsp:Transcript_41887/g.127013  ORF Transcript_41887/g.127013 Transcript_41887/m.127013 type:complete len:224 (+) Transcript_41887:447-1118(+)
MDMTSAIMALYGAGVSPSQLRLTVSKRSRGDANRRMCPLFVLLAPQRFLLRIFGNGSLSEVTTMQLVELEAAIHQLLVEVRIQSRHILDAVQEAGECFGQNPDSLPVQHVQDGRQSHRRPPRVRQRRLEHSQLDEEDGRFLDLIPRLRRDLVDGQQERKVTHERLGRRRVDSVLESEEQFPLHGLDVGDAKISSAQADERVDPERTSRRRSCAGGGRRFAVQL